MQYVGSVRIAPTLTLLIISFFGLAPTYSHASDGALRESLTFYASFDRGTDADFAVGDKTLYGAVNRSKPDVAHPGLPDGDAIQLVKGEGRFGDALLFTKKSDAIVYFKGQDNFVYRTNNWEGSISFWLKLDPDADLKPGYCDPLQIAAGHWNNGVFFAEFSKDDPRHFRFALRPLFSIWNPNKVGWEAIPVAQRPMVEVEKAPFSRERWTHVVFTFANANTGSKEGIGQLYLNGKKAGEFKDWDLTVNWKPEQMLVILGVFYVGLLDEVALFNRALKDGEVQTIYAQENGLHALIGVAR